jgi:hypothetical protein
MDPNMDVLLFLEIGGRLNPRQEDRAGARQTGSDNTTGRTPMALQDRPSLDTDKCSGKTGGPLRFPGVHHF